MRDPTSTVARDGKGHEAARTSDSPGIVDIVIVVASPRPSGDNIVAKKAEMTILL